MSTPTRVLGLVEFDTKSDSEKLHSSETLRKCLTYLKSMKRPKIDNSKLLDGVDRVSRSIEGCIKLAESTLGSSKPQQNQEALNPPHEWLGDILSGIDQVDSTLINCIKMVESTMQNKKKKSGGGICGDLERQTPGLFGWDRLSPGNFRTLHQNLLTVGFLNQPNPYSTRISTNS